MDIFKKLRKKYFQDDLYLFGNILLDEDIEVYNLSLISSGNIGYICHDKDDVWSIGVEESLDAHTKRFVIAHELGHYFLHAHTIEKGYIRVDALSAIRWRENASLFDPGEREAYEANAFAAEILAPAQTIVKAMGEYGFINAETRKKLSLFFGVPAEVIYYRLIELGYVQ